MLRRPAPDILPTVTRHLTLLIPGLLDTPAAPLSHLLRSLGTQLPPLSALRYLLSRARLSVAKKNILDLLADVLAIPGNPPPWAALALRGDEGAPGSDYWLNLEPVVLQPDRDCLRLVACGELALSADQAAALVSELNDYLRVDGLTLEAPRPGRWYLRLPADPQITTVPAQQALGADVAEIMPYGKQQAFWRRLINELQMVLHASPVNQQRLTDGLPAINSVWPWGGGALTTPVWHSPYQILFAGSAVMRGIAACTAAQVLPVADDGEELLAAMPAEARALAMLPGDFSLSTHGDPMHWLGIMDSLERAWFEPLLSALKSGNLRGLTLLFADGREFSLTPAQLRRWWRRVRPLEAWL